MTANLSDIPEPLRLAHEISGVNSKILAGGRQKCGCFGCGKIFDSGEIDLAIYTEPSAVQCPYCLMDALLPESAGFPITPEFLAEMHDVYFSVV